MKNGSMAIPHLHINEIKTTHIATQKKDSLNTKTHQKALTFFKIHQQKSSSCIRYKRERKKNILKKIYFFVPEYISEY